MSLQGSKRFAFPHLSASHRKGCSPCSLPAGTGGLLVDGEASCKQKLLTFFLLLTQKKDPIGSDVSVGNPFPPEFPVCLFVNNLKFKSRISFFFKKVLTKPILIC